jgi:hypothetical protein
MLPEEWLGSVGIGVSRILWYRKPSVSDNTMWVPGTLDAGSIENGSVNYDGNALSGMKFKFVMNDEQGWSNEIGGRV